MRFSTALAVFAAAAANAQRPSDVSICDYYTKALLKDNTAKNQATLLTLLVNTVVIGNYTTPNKNAVPGILAPGEVNGAKVNLLPYFSGGLVSTNANGKAQSVNFLDGGGAEPLKKNMPANDMSSRQYFLLTHLYEFFGGLLGCSMQGMTGFDAYSGRTSMYEVHKFMDLDSAEVTYFVTQVGLAAASFGVAKEDIAVAAGALNSLFNVKCGPPMAVLKNTSAELQSICIADDCPLAKNATCDKYEKASMPSKASSMASMSGTMMPTGSMTESMTGSMATSGSMAMSGSMTMTGSMSMATSGMATASGSGATVPTGAANANGLGLAGVAAGVLAFVL